MKKVIAGPAGHWYALMDYAGSAWLVGLPMVAGNDTPPPHPDTDPDGWGDITDPAPETDTDALIAELRR